MSKPYIPFNLNTPPAPCKDCTKRTVGCHSGCADYGEYRSKIINFNTKIKQAKKERAIINDIEVQRSLKARNNKTMKQV